MHFARNFPSLAFQPSDPEPEALLSVAAWVKDAQLASMTPDVVEHAFDPFYTTKPKGRGTGLGLAMVKCFVDRFAGQVRVRSAAGEGTTIALYLPTR